MSKGAKTREILCKKVSTSSRFFAQQYHQAHTLAQSDSYARVCVLVWHRNMDNCERKLQAVPFHCTHTNTPWDWHYPFCTLVCVYLHALSASHQFIGFATVRKQQQQQQQPLDKGRRRRGKTTTEICLNLSTSNCFAIYMHLWVGKKFIYAVQQTDEFEI